MSVLVLNDLSIHHNNEAIVQHVNLTIKQGEWFALVGESGSGKSVTASAIGRILPKSLKVQTGAVYLADEELLSLSENEMQDLRGNKISYVFQDYEGAFAPFLTIGKQFDETLKTHTDMQKKERKAISLQALRDVSLPENRTYESYPFQLSGGQLQRAAIALAMLLKPKLLIADEPTTALDSLTTIKVLDLLKQLQAQTGCAVLFITHDLRQVRKYADTLAIMKQGMIVESGSKDAIFRRPQQAYTKMLLSAIPPLKNAPSRLLTFSNEEQERVGGTG